MNAYHREEEHFRVVVCLLRFAKIRSFIVTNAVLKISSRYHSYNVDYRVLAYFVLGNLHVSNAYDSSQLVFNPNTKEAKEIKEVYNF